MTEQTNLSGDQVQQPNLFGVSAIMLVQLIDGSNTDPHSYGKYREFALANLPLPMDEERVNFLSGAISAHSTAVLANSDPESREAKKHGKETAGRVISWIGGLACSIEDLATTDSAVVQLRSLGGRQNRKDASSLASKVKFTRRMNKFSRK